MKKRFGVIGDPVSHSLSPVIHHHFLSQFQIDGDYQKIHIKANEFDQKIYELKEQNLDGFNITVPFKTAILPFLDELSEEAKNIGAVNTVVNESGKWIGYNTDGFGFVQMIKNMDINLSNQKIAIIGAGGSTKSIYYYLIKEQPLLVDIANRTVEKAIKLIDRYQSNYSRNQAMSLEELEENISQYDIVIQTTSVGMVPKLNDMPIQLRNLNEGAFVFDIIYTPYETKFLKEAKKRGAICCNGLDMLLYQAAYAFYIWTKRMPNIELAKEQIMKTIKGA